MLGKSKITWGLISLAITLIALHTGCSGVKSITKNSDAGYLLRYRLAENQSLNYRISANEKFLHLLFDGGENLRSETNEARNFTVTFIREDAGKNMVTSISLGDMSYDSESTQSLTNIDFSKVKGKTFNMNLTALGQEFEYTGIENLYGIVSETYQEDRVIPIKGIFNDIFVNLPEKPVKIGETWQLEGSNTSTDEIRRIINTVNYKILCTLEGLENINNRDCLKIKMALEGKGSGAGITPVGPLETSGKSKGTVTVYFDHLNGVLLGITSDMVTSGIINIFIGPKTYFGFPFKNIKKTEMVLVQ